MHKDHFILFPAFLIIFASFLAFSMDDLTFQIGSKDGVSGVIGFAIAENTNLTGCNLKDSILFMVSDVDNAHAGIINYSSYDYCVYLETDEFVVENVSRDCVNYGKAVSKSNRVVYLSGVDNAHVYGPGYDVSYLPNGYEDVCYEDIYCVEDYENDACSSLNNNSAYDYECVVSISNDGNAHVQECVSNGDYDVQICCTSLTKGEDGCPEKTTLCEDGYCHESCDDFGGSPGCVGGQGNGVCEDEEGCDCIDCETKQDSCEEGLVCLGGVCMSYGEDKDNDGLVDVLDNCPEHPNYNVSGTCIDSLTMSNPYPLGEPYICSGDDDCGNFEKEFNLTNATCEMTQANPDNDQCGNACDLDSNEVCTCYVTYDNCQPPGDCEESLQSFVWNTAGPVDEGTGLTLTLTASEGKCDGTGFSVAIYDEEHDMYSTVTPQPITVSGNVGSTSWIAEHNLDDVKKLQYWGAQAFEGGGGEASISTTGDVGVSSAGHECGDNVTDPGEQCDDGNNVNYDGCDADCKLEGSGGGSKDCDTYCVPFTCVCDGDKAYKCCGDYDGDGCYEYSNKLKCQSGKVCGGDFGKCVDPVCVVSNQPQASPSCTGITGYACGKWSDCGDDGYAYRTCIKCSGNCPSNPMTKVKCSKEPPAKVPVFTGMNFMIVLLMLVLFYVFRRSVRVS